MANLSLIKSINRKNSDSDFLWLSDKLFLYLVKALTLSHPGNITET